MQLPQQKPIEVPKAVANPLPFPSIMLAPISRPATMSHDTDEDEGLKHFEQVTGSLSLAKHKENCWRELFLMGLCIAAHVKKMYFPVRRPKRW